MKCIYNEPNILGECPLWDHHENQLYWIDIEAKKIHALQIESNQHHIWDLPSKPGSIALHSEGGLLVALFNQLVHFFAR